MGWPDRHECFVIPSKHKAIRVSSLSMEEILSSSVVMVKKQEGICLERTKCRFSKISGSNKSIHRFELRRVTKNMNSFTI